MCQVGEGGFALSMAQSRPPPPLAGEDYIAPPP